MQIYRKALLFIAVLLLLWSVPVPAQRDSGIVLRSETRLVQVEVLVRDSSGKPVEDLQRGDFTILDNGKPRTFEIFSVNRAGAKTAEPQPAAKPVRSPLPPGVFSNIGEPPPSADGHHATVILLDGANGWFESYVWGSKAIQGLMDKLPPDESIAVYVIDKFEGVLLAVDYTTDREQTKKTMKTFMARGMSPAPVGMGQGPDGAGLLDVPEQSIQSRSQQYLNGGSREFEFRLRRGSEDVRVAFSALAEKLRKVPGRKSVFWVTEGFPPRVIRDEPAWHNTVKALNDANVAVSTVDTDGLGGPSRLWGPGGIITMKWVAHQTGGQSFYHRNDLDTALAVGVANSRSSYTLGFYIHNLDGRYHDLEVHVDRPGLTLDHRQGYDAQTDAMHDLANRKTELESVLLSPLNLLGVGITASVEMKAGNLVVHLRLSPESLTLTGAGGAWTGRVESLLLERTATGRQLAHVKQTTTIQIGSAGKEDYDRRGPVVSQSIRYVPGATTLVIVIRDSASGRTGSLTLPLTEPVSP